MQYYFGDRLFFYDKSGWYLGRSALIDSTTTKVTTFGEVGLAVIEEPDYLLKEGGIICLKGWTTHLFTRVLAYGDVNPSVILQAPINNPKRVLSSAATDSPCTGLGIDELTSDDTSDIPGPGESYQRTGFGLAPEDFSWIVAPETLGERNVGQQFPRCTNECDREGRYRIHKKGLFGRCREKCNCDFLVKIRTRFFGWECGTCDE
jgi:hypothetical protein